ncbi:ABC-type sugar transport system ATPase subunit [Bacillus sp. SORGH_AS 510]|uniref:sugar ABC transporter ATP-binding protein n=1 Tax=Bacillus sp. SORGH_AS_0510 TaxID=3041771 RepID=UPI00277E92AA|nr:sugar ABC transporter ATP-binding protein [Bacillus sp. SORGH_AS_0510]MDQ1143796.1 ABC-type sugar transport system ATPase subunit [Bacillus sp. SORGH_AS_0510]
MKILEANNITKRFPGVVALDSVDIAFEPGKIHCIIGENGAGKSTLVKILTGVYTPDEGEIQIANQDVRANKQMFDKVAYVPQELDLFKNMTVAENLFMPFSKTGFNSVFVNKKELYKQADPYLKKFQITARPDDHVFEISVSEQQLLQIAHGTVDQFAEIILLDEPTTSLTNADTERLFEVLFQLKKENKAIVFISHKLEEIFAIGDEITVLRNGRKVAHSELNKVDIPWVIKQMTGREIDENTRYQSEKVTDEVILDVDNLTGEKFSNISFQLRKGEILGFSGLVGAGRTEIMQTIFGYLPAWAGAVKLEGKPWKLGDTHHSVNNGMVYIPEERKQQGILPSLSVKENISVPLLKRLKNFMMISGKKEKAVANEIINAYQVKTASMNKEIKFLSGGNQQKIIIGRSMYLKPKILIFDEPTKGIDVGAKAEIYKIMKQLAEDGMGIILISSEIEEIKKCSNRIITIYEGEKVDEFETNQAENSSIINSIMGVKKRLA